MKIKLLFTLIVLLIVPTLFAQVANQPSDYILCEDYNDFSDQDETETFDLFTKDSEILQSQDPNLYGVSYYLSQIDAENTTNVLPQFFTNTSNPQTIYVRVEEFSTGNYDTTLFNLFVPDVPFIPDTDFAVCDFDGDGEVELNLNSTESGYSISYHLTTDDAEQDINALSSQATFQEPNIPSYLYARAENSYGCFYVVPRRLYYDVAVLANTLTPLETCGNNGIAQFYLSYKNDEVTGGLPLTVSYHLTENEAENGSSALPFNYINTSNPQTIYVRVRNTTCFDVTSLELITNEGTPLNLGNIDDQITCNWLLSYDLTQHEPVLLENEDPTGLMVSYYKSLSNLYNQENQIANPTAYMLTAFNENETIYVRVDNSISGCYDFDQFNLEGKEEIELSPITIEACDTYGDGIEVFDLFSNYFDIVIGGSGVSLRFYETEEDAINNSNHILTSGAYESGNRTLYARGFYNNANCSEIVPITLVVSSGPDISTLDLVYCDTGFIGSEIVSLSEVENSIISSLDQNFSYDIRFFNSESDALSNTNQNNGSQINVFSEGVIIYVRIVNLTQDGCPRVVPISMELITPPTIEAVSPLQACDDDTDGFAMFNLTQSLNSILSELPDVEVSFYATQADAETALNALPLLYLTNSNEIFIRIFDISTGCYNVFTLPLQYVCNVPINCTDNALNITFCYDDNAVTVFQYSSTNGMPLTVVFNSGEVEDDYDRLVVLDSDGVTNLNEDSPYGSSGNISGLTFTSSGDSITIMVDSDEIVSCASEESGTFEPINFNVFCSNQVGQINVNAFFDTNSNGIQEINEPNFTQGVLHYEVNNDGIINETQSTSGDYKIISDDGNNLYDISYMFDSDFGGCYELSTSIYENVSIDLGETTDIKFPIVELNSCQDIAVYLIENNPPRPGFSNFNTIYIENRGSSSVASGTVNFIIDEVLEYEETNSFSNGLSVTDLDNGFTASFTNILPGQVMYLNADVYCPTNVVLGTMVTNITEYVDATEDIITENNIAELTSEVIGSFDPNDKMESHGGQIVYDEFSDNDYLYYTIRFQNLGTANAINVEVIDVLDNQLDASTFRMLNASHEVQYERVNNTITWSFDNIQLPPESIDELASNGFVHFRIKPLQGYNVGDVIPNNASIYFDFNDPIITNTFTTEFVENLSINTFYIEDASLYPNPTAGFLNFVLINGNRENIKIEMFDLKGKKIHSELLLANNTQTKIDVSSFAKGVYLLKASIESSVFIKKVIIKD